MMMNTFKLLKPWCVLSTHLDGMLLIGWKKSSDTRIEAEKKSCALTEPDFVV